ncbi:MAG: hypothetical protein LQ343_007720 [Gyalolechia ehrenbergii]|nr:MAG: hypothetical protein LQ343_007720 [Gyalolechia ehrenbergii]
MGLFSGWLGNSNPDSNTKNDPLRDLDPSLREFLEKESPVKYETSPPPPPPAPQIEPSTAAQTSTGTSAENTPSVPPESLFQDGRYAHLWKTYKPRAEVENTYKSEQEKLMDLLEGYQSRKARIGKAALENCAEEQEAMSDCYRNGSWKSKMTMCRPENKAFERCYTMQARFLKALGYLSAYDRPAEIDERIQMHADTLYHRMLAQEAAVAEAKASDAPIPSFAPLIPAPASSSSPDKSTPTISTGQPVSASAAATLESARPMSYEESKAVYLKRLKPHVRQALEEQWEKKKLSSEEKMLEARAYAMEAEAGVGVANQVGQMMQDVQKGREQRRKEGTATLGDTVSGWLGR